jgi:hypothetical protein
MADKRLSELDELTTVGDETLFLVTEATASKRITHNNVLHAQKIMAKICPNSTVDSTTTDLPINGGNF